MSVCPKGTFCPRRGLSNPLPCRAQFYCPNEKMSNEIPCPPGFYCQESTIQPEICPKNHYCPERSEAPIQCIGLTVSNPGSPSCSLSTSVYIIIAVIIGVMIGIVVIVVIMKFRKRKPAQNDNQTLLMYNDSPQYTGL